MFDTQERGCMFESPSGHSQSFPSIVTLTLVHWIQMGLQDS